MTRFARSRRLGHAPPSMLTRTRRLSRLRLAAPLLGLALFTSACAANAPQDTNRPEGPIARQLDRLFDPVFLVAAVIFVLVQGLVLYVSIRYRSRSDADAPKQIHGHTALEITWTIIPALILAVIGVFTVATVFDINEIEKGPDVLTVDVVGHQWWWEYDYKDLDIVTANELHIPTGRRVELNLKSVDVIHSFWAPRLAGKVDVVPGRVNTMALEADRPGVYLGQCVEFCGIAHSRMRLRVVAQSPEDFEQWTLAQQRPAAAVGSSDAAEGAELFQSRGCTGCHTVEGVSDAKIGPNLTHLHSRATFAGSLFDLTDQNLRKWLRDPQKEKPGNLMKLPVPLKEEEITKLIAYLRTLK